MTFPRPILIINQEKTPLEMNEPITLRFKTSHKTHVASAYLLVVVISCNQSKFLKAFELRLMNQHKLVPIAS